MGKSSVPQAPDYTAAAKATSAGNLQNAQIATQANRPNMTTPWGTSTWTQTPQYDMNAYENALNAYKQSSATPSEQLLTSDGVPMAVQNSGYGGKSGAAPKLSDYATGTSWSNNVSLSPQQQALFNQQNSLQQGLFGAQNNALNYVNQNMSKPFSGQSIDPNSFTYGSVLDPNSIKLGNVLDTSNLQYGNVLDPNSLPSLGSIYDPTKSTNNATQLIMDRLNPQLDRQQESLRTQLANQGVSQGSDAYNNAIESFGRTRNDANNQAALYGINLGMGQQAQTYGQQMGNRASALGTQAQQFGQQDTNLQRYLGAQGQQFGQTNANAGLFGQLQNQAFNQQNANNSLYANIQNQGFQQDAYKYNLPMNTLNALRAGNQVSAPQFQSFANQGYVPGPDYTGAAGLNYQAALGNANAQNAAGGNNMAGLFGLAKTGLQAYFGA